MTVSELSDSQIIMTMPVHVYASTYLCGDACAGGSSMSTPSICHCRSSLILSLTGKQSVLAIIRYDHIRQPMQLHHAVFFIFRGIERNTRTDVKIVQARRRDSATFNVESNSGDPSLTTCPFLSRFQDWSPLVLSKCLPGTPWQHVCHSG